MPRPRALILSALLLVLPCLAAAQTVTGTVLYRERMVLPDGAALRVALRDLDAGAGAAPLAESRQAPLGAPPYAFALEPAADAIAPDERYGVTATILLDDRAFMETPEPVAVLTGGAPADVELIVRRLPDGPGPMPTAPAPPWPGPAAHGLDLPATYAGTLPGPEGAPAAWHLDLLRDQTYHLRLVAEGSDLPPRDRVGRWHLEPGGGVLALARPDAEPWRFAAEDAAALRLLSARGFGAEGALQRAESFDPTPLRLPLRGMLRYMADAATLRECRSGHGYPVALAEDWPALERAYLRTVEDGGAPLMATLDARIEMRDGMEGPPRPTVVVERFTAVWPEEDCAPVMAEAPIRETAWRFLSIGGEEVALSEERREPVLRLRGGADPRFTATVGCNTVTGGFDLGEGTLAFRPGPTTLMACTPELDALERRMISALEATQGYATDAGVLDLLDSGGRVLARLQAVYVP